jgi:hypothetical protein
MFYFKYQSLKQRREEEKQMTTLNLHHYMNTHVLVSSSLFLRSTRLSTQLYLCFHLSVLR